MQNDLQDAYDKLSKYYRPLAVQRKHFDDQIKLLQALFHRNGKTTQTRILDAACGTGDVLAGLYRDGYHALAGVDGSAAMVAQAQILPEMAYVPVEACDWQDLGRYFKENGTFDFVFVLGHALPHASKTEIPGIIKEVFEGLSPGGVFTFDLRMWARNEEGILVEPGRPVGIFRWLGEIEDEDGRKYWMDDRCSYLQGRQYITYRFRRIKQGGVGWDCEEQLVLSYALFDLSEARGWFLQGGFMQDQIELEFPKDLGYSYAVITARRV